MIYTFRNQQGLTLLELIALVLIILAAILAAVVIYFFSEAEDRIDCIEELQKLALGSISFQNSISLEAQNRPVPQDRIDRLLVKCSEVNAQTDRVNTVCGYVGEDIVGRLNCENEVSILR